MYKALSLEVISIGVFHIRKTPPLGWGKQQWPECQSPYHLRALLSIRKQPYFNNLRHVSHNKEL